MKRIVIIGELKSPNLGDSVICNVSESLIRKFHNDSTISLIDISIAKRPNTWLFCKIEHYVRNKIVIIYKLYLYIFSYLYFWKHIPCHSIVVLAGGALIQNFFAESLVSILRICRKKKCKIIFFSLGIGPLTHIYKRMIEEEILINQNRISISLRDHLDYFDERVKVCRHPDIAICSNIVYQCRYFSKGTVGIGIIDVELYNVNNPVNIVTEDEYFNGLMKIINILHEKDFRVELFCNGDFSDYAAAERFLSFSKFKNVNLRQRPTIAEDLVSIISSYQYVIASRLHAIIISYAYKIHCFGLSWDSKVDEFFSFINMKKNCLHLDQIMNIDAQGLIDTLLLTEYDINYYEQLQEEVINQIRTL